MQEARKKTVGGQAENTNAEKRLGQNEPIVSTPKSTAEAIAREIGVSESTVKRAEKFSKGIDALENVSKEASEKVLRGGSGVTKATIMELPKITEEIQSEIDAITNLFKAEMGARSTDELAGTDWKVSWKPVTSSRLDTAALKKELPEVVERFSKTTTVKRFSIV